MISRPSEGSYEKLHERLLSIENSIEKPLNSRLKKIVDAIPPGSKVLDVACGTGRVLQAAVAKGCTGRGIEIVAARVESARNKGLDVMQGDVDTWPENEAVRDLLFSPYDVVVFSKCLMYLKSKNEIMERLNTKLIIIFQNNPGNLRARFNGERTATLEWNKKLPYHLKGGEEIAISSPSSLSKWGASYGYGKCELLSGGIWVHSMILKMEAGF